MRPGSTSHERELVRQAARANALDWYLTALLSPRRAREDLLTIAAYLGELARIPRIVSDPALGMIRLAWWRDAVEADAPSGNPIADELIHTVRRLAIPRELVLLALEGRVRELDEDGMADEAAFGAYLAETGGVPFRLAARALGVTETSRICRACAAAGEAWGRVRLGLDLALHLSKGRLPLPRSRFPAGDPRGLPQSEVRLAVRGETAALAKEARDALAEARAVLETLPGEAFAVFIPLALVEPYLRVLEEERRDPLLLVADIRPLTRVSRLWLAKLRGSV